MRRFDLFGIISVIFSLLLLSGCSSAFTKMEPIGEYEMVAFYKMSVDDFPRQSEIKKELLPLVKFPELSPEKIQAILSILKYKRDTLWGSQIRPVFYREELKGMIPLLMHSLKKLEENERLVVISRFDPDRSVLSRMERVTMVLWADEAGINVLLGEIREEIPHNDPLTEDEWRRILPISMKRAYPDLSLVPEKDQYTLKEVLGHTHFTWAVFDPARIDQISSEVSDVKDGESKEGTEAEGGDLAQRLRSLKKAHEEGLISDEEYQEKRKELLDGL